MNFRALVLAPLVLLTACDAPLTSEDAAIVSDDAASAVDALVETVDAATPPVDARVLPPDAGTRPDASMDGGPWPSSACEPTGGAERFEDPVIYCAGTTELAIMRGIESPHLAVHAAVQIVGLDTTDCMAVDAAQLLAPDGSVVAELGAGTGRMGNVTYGAPILTAEIPAPLAAVCDGDELERFDRYLVHLEGRVNGGTFSVTCGSTDSPSTFWPPKTGITCHEGLDRSPAGFSWTRMGMLLEGRVGIPHGPTGAVLSVEGDTSILELPYTVGFFGRMPAMRFTGPTLERSLVSESTRETWTASNVLTITVGTTSELGRCAPDARSLRLIRFGGMTVRGPFVSEAWTGCT
jgi:hypothetical protein